MRVVIVGAGFGGLLIARKLSAVKGISLTLISPKKYFLFTPRLIDLINHPSDKRFTVKSLGEAFPKDLGVSLQFGRATFVDMATKEVQVGGKKVQYDILVLAHGARTNYFGVPGAEKHCLVVKEFEDIGKAQQRIRDALGRAKTAPEKERDAWSRFVIVGGGATGIELAAELEPFVRREAMARHIAKTTVVIVHRGSAIVPYMHPIIIRRAGKALTERRISVMTKTGVTSCSETGVLTDNGEISARTLFWATGIEVNPLKLEPEPSMVRGRIGVTPDMRVVGQKDVFAVGDCSAHEKPLPQTAQVARLEALHVIKNLLRIMKGKEPLPYIYKQRGEMLYLGRKKTFVVAFGLVFNGWLGNLFRHWYYRKLFKEYT